MSSSLSVAVPEHHRPCFLLKSGTATGCSPLCTSNWSRSEPLCSRSSLEFTFSNQREPDAAEVQYLQVKAASEEFAGMYKQGPVQDKCLCWRNNICFVNFPQNLLHTG